jgi:hypothetical protein
MWLLGGVKELRMALQGNSKYPTRTIFLNPLNPLNFLN